MKRNDISFVLCFIVPFMSGFIPMVDAPLTEAAALSAQLPLATPLPAGVPYIESIVQPRISVTDGDL